MFPASWAGTPISISTPPAAMRHGRSGTWWPPGLANASSQAAFTSGRSARIRDGATSLRLRRTGFPRSFRGSRWTMVSSTCSCIRTPVINYAITATARSGSADPGRSIWKRSEAREFRARIASRCSSPSWTISPRNWLTFGYRCFPMPTILGSIPLNAW